MINILFNLTNVMIIRRRINFYITATVISIISVGVSLNTAVRAEYVPGIGSWSINHLYRSEEDVHLKLRHPRMTEETWPQINIPKSYIYFATGPNQRASHPVNSGEILDRLSISFLYGDDKSYIYRLFEYQKVHPKRSLDEIADTLRAKLIIASLAAYVNPNFEADTRRGAAASKTQVADFDGLKQFKLLPNGYSYFQGEDSDMFLRARCPNEMHPRILCSFIVKINNKVTAEVTFSDFRQFGGRKWANDRIASIRKNICRFIKGC